MSELKLVHGMYILRKKDMRVWLIDEKIKGQGAIAVNPDNHEDFTFIRLKEELRQIFFEQPNRE